MPESTGLLTPLSLCGSTPHRAVLGLLLHALDAPTYPGLEKDLAQSDAEHLAAITNHGHAQTILITALRKTPSLTSHIPRDLEVYFAEMARANAARNHHAKTQLQEIANILLPAGIPVLALKGAADLLNPIHDGPEHRYISDLDLLIPDDRIKDAAVFLRQAKGLPTGSVLTEPGTHHHLAQIIHPDWPLTIELHVRPGSEVVQSVLASKTMLENAKPTDINGILIPDIQDRFLHHILHGMELRHQTAALNLRMLADHVQYLRVMTPSEQKQALTRLEDIGYEAWQSDLSQLTRSLETLSALPGDCWAARALQNFGDPEAARRQDTEFWIRHYLRRFWHSKTYRQQILRKLTSPTAWSEFVAFHRDRRSKFR